eukprot:3586351-Lingulodinium_polyedra.AAC.1
MHPHGDPVGLGNHCQQGAVLRIGAEVQRVSAGPASSPLRLIRASCAQMRSAPESFRQPPAEPQLVTFALSTRNGP